MDYYFNVLITSISKKVPLITAVRKALNELKLPSKIFGGDSNPQCIARYFVDDFWQMPLQDVLGIEDLLDYCKRNEIKAIIPTRDGELAFFAKYQVLLLEKGVFCMVSPERTIKICHNKLVFYEFLFPFKFPVILTTRNVHLIQAPSYVVKECFGSGSHKIGLNLPLSKAKAWAETLSSPIFQPYIQGKEYSVDVYINRQGTLQESIARVREIIVEGESQVTFSVNYPELERLCLKAACQLEVYGHAVFQVLCDSSQHFHLIECNTRFGGASTLSVAMGLNSFVWFFQEVLQKPLSPFRRSLKELRQVRYPQDKVIAL